MPPLFVFYFVSIVLGLAKDKADKAAAGIASLREADAVTGGGQSRTQKPGQKRRQTS